jgi:hypothetical protein
VTPQMRCIVASWLSEVAAEFRLQQETLFLAVRLLDRFQAVSPAVSGPPLARPPRGPAHGRRREPQCGPDNHRAAAPPAVAQGCFSAEGGNPPVGPSARCHSILWRCCESTRSIPSTQGVPRNVLQLVAVACMMVASKQDEVSCVWGWAVRSCGPVQHPGGRYSARA